MEERLKTVENEKLMLLEENDKLKQTGKSAKCIEDSLDYFDLSWVKHEESRFSPKLTRKQNNSQGHYFNCLMGIIMLCTIYTSAGIQIQQELQEYNTDVESRVNEPHSVRQNEIITTEDYAFNELYLEANYQKIKESRERLRNYYYCRRNGLGSLRPTKDNDNDRDLFDQAQVHFRRFMKRVIGASFYLINFSMEPRVVMIIFLVWTLVHSILMAPTDWGQEVQHHKKIWQLLMFRMNSQIQWIRLRVGTLR